MLLCQKQRFAKIKPNYRRPIPMSDNIVHVTDASFETDVLQSDIPALVDFWAEWCGPCKMIAPILDEISAEYAGKIKICKVDVDSNPETAAKFNVRGIPTLLVFKNGAVEATKVGALSKGQLTEFVDIQV
jgi:thioredoxin 1